MLAAPRSPHPRIDGQNSRHLALEHLRKPPLAPWTLERAIRAARVKVPGLPPTFRYHDLRHYLASMLIASGADVRDADESTRAAIDSVMAARADYLRTAGGREM